MIVLVLFAIFALAFQAATICDAGQVQDCYNMNVWNEKLPPGNVSPCSATDEVLSYSAKQFSVLEGESVHQAFFALVIGAGSDNATLDTWCKNDGYDQYNMSMYITEGTPTSMNFTDALLSIKNVVKIDFTDAPKNFDQLSTLTLGDAISLVTFIVQSTTNSAKYYRQLKAPVGTHNYKANLVYEHPPGKTDCYLKVGLYSCYATNATSKLLIILGIVGGVVAVVVLCPIITCLICVCCCCVRMSIKRKNKIRRTG